MHVYLSILCSSSRFAVFPFLCHCNLYFHFFFFLYVFLAIRVSVCLFVFPYVCLSSFLHLSVCGLVPFVFVRSCVSFFSTWHNALVGLIVCLFLGAVFSYLFLPLTSCLHSSVRLRSLVCFLVLLMTCSVHTLVRCFYFRVSFFYYCSFQFTSLKKDIAETEQYL